MLPIGIDRLSIGIDCLKVNKKGRVSVLHKYSPFFLVHLANITVDVYRNITVDEENTRTFLPTGARNSHMCGDLAAVS